MDSGGKKGTERINVGIGGGISVEVEGFSVGVEGVNDGSRGGLVWELRE